MDDKTTPAETTESTDDVDGGKGTTEEATPDQSKEVPFEDRLNKFYEKKGWDAEKGQQQLLKSYEELESKMGNFKEVEEKAKMYDELGLSQEQITELQTKAKQYDEALAQLQQQQLDQELNKDEVDYNQFTTEQLAQFYRNGQISIADLPPQRQYEVQKFVSDQDSAQERQYEQNAKELGEKYPEVFKDKELVDMVATLIESGTKPDKAAQLVQSKLQAAERQGEEKTRKEIEELKGKGTERTSSSASTVPTKKVDNVRDAFKYAKQKLSG